MRILFAVALFALAVECEAQDVIVRRVELPPPTTFAGLQQLPGPPPSGPCTFPAVSLPVDSLSPITLGDSAKLRLPPGWQTSPLHPSDDQTYTRLAAPGDNRVLIERKRNGASGRSFLMYRNGEVPEGTTCSLERGQTGAIWSFYLPDPQDASGVRKYTAVGSVITPAGLWYGVMLTTSSAADQIRLASVLTQVMLLPSP
jgi:hypothetical protein